MVTKTKASIEVARRDVLGKKVSQLRRSGLTPANLYGKHVDSVAIQFGSEEFRQFLRGHSRNEIIYLKIDGEDRPTFIRDIQRNPVTDQILQFLREVVRGSGVANHRRTWDLEGNAQLPGSLL